MAERYGSKTDVAVKLILVFFISLLSFSVGTFVGKKFSDNQHKISQLESQDKGDESADNDSGAEKSDKDREVASVQGSTEVKPNEALNDEEIKKLAEEFVTDDEGGKKVSHEEGKPTRETAGEKKDEAVKAEGKPQASKSTTAEEAAPKEIAKASKETAREPAKESSKETVKFTAKPNTAANRVVAGQTPEEEITKVETPKARVPQSLPQEIASSAIGKFTVQVASYPTQAEAEKSANSLKAKGFNAFYVDAKVKNQTWYRVSVGLFTTQKEADAYKADLLARAKVTSAIVQKITN